jgi:hypothetical protein
MFKLLLPLVFLNAATLSLLAQDKNAGTVQIITTFDYPRAGTEDTFAAGISDRGEVGGSFTFRHQIAEGFERNSHGRISPPIVFPASGVTSTSVAKVNGAGLACGTFEISDLTGFVYHGFFFDGASYTQYDYPGSTFTQLYDLNDAGDYVGQLGLPLQSFSSIGGTVVTVAIAGAQFTSATGINNLDQITGAYGGPDGYHGFVLKADGTLIGPLDYPGASHTFPFRLNDKGVVVGTWIDSTGTGHGFILRLPSQFIGYDYPGAGETTLEGINNSGVITGNYRDSADHYHAFLARLAR